MIKKIHLHLIIMSFLTLIVIGGIIYYFINNNQTESKKITGGEVATILEGNGSNNNSQPLISSQNAYMVEVLDIRGSINKNIEELISQSKYPTLFQKDEMIGKAENIKSDIAKGIERLKKLNLTSDLQTLNKNHIKSLELLNEAMDAYIAMQNANDQTEKQKQSELFSYKIEESNKAIQSQSGANSTNSTGNYNTNLNVSDVLQ